MKPSFQQQTSDGIDIQYYEQPVENPRAVICMVHGMGEYMGRYGHVADFFNARGMAVIGFDQRGHGRSGGKRGHTPSYAHLQESVAQLIETAAAKYPGVPLVLYGHSMGGNLVLNYAIRNGSGIKAVVGSSPYLKLAFNPPAWKVTLASVVKNILPGLQQPTGLDTAMLSHDPAVAAAYEADPLVHGQISTTYFFSVHEAGPWAIEHAAELKVPTLVFHGTGDKITSHEATREFAEKSNGKAELKLWDSLYHETHNEPEYKTVLGFAADWIEKHV